MRQGQEARRQEEVCRPVTAFAGAARAAPAPFKLRAMAKKPADREEGWKDDPKDPELERYWRGKYWSEIRRPKNPETFAARQEAAKLQLSTVAPTPSSTAPIPGSADDGALPTRPPIAPEGWYLDQLDPTQERYWTGTNWTYQVRPRRS